MDTHPRYALAHDGARHPQAARRCLSRRLSACRSRGSHYRMSRDRHGRVSISAGHRSPLIRQVSSAISGMAGTSRSANRFQGGVHRTQERVSAISVCSSLLVRSRQ